MKEGSNKSAGGTLALGDRTNGGIASKALLWLLMVAIAGGAIYGTYVWQRAEVDDLNQQISQLNSKLSTANKSGAPLAQSEYSSKNGVIIKVYTPPSKSTLTSPVIIMGEVPGTWSFEASFPVKLLDAKGKVIAQAPAQLLGSWTTEEFVPFTAKLPYSAASNGDGTLLLQKDNPSGLKANDDSVAIPIKL